MYLFRKWIAVFFPSLKSRNVCAQLWEKQQFRDISHHNFTFTVLTVKLLKVSNSFNTFIPFLKRVLIILSKVSFLSSHVLALHDRNSLSSDSLIKSLLQSDPNSHWFTSIAFFFFSFF